MPNLPMAKEVGYGRYFARRLLWKVNALLFRRTLLLRLATGRGFPLPPGSFFASDVFVTRGNVDWNSEHLLAKFLATAKPPGDFLDIGAHIGYYSALMSPVVRRCYAFEPDGRNMGNLRRALGSCDNVETFPTAVADTVGTTFMDVSAESSLSHLSASGSTPVEVTTIDAFCSRHAGIRVSGVKIDIEGFDILALEGAIETARSQRPVFLIEFGIEPGRPNSPERLRRFLDAAGYTLFAVCRSDPTAFRCEYRFRELDPGQHDSDWTKMLFLAPRECRFFQDLAQALPPALARPLRPKGSTAFLKDSPR